MREIFLKTRGLNLRNVKEEKSVTVDAMRDQRAA